MKNSEALLANRFQLEVGSDKNFPYYNVLETEYDGGALSIGFGCTTDFFAPAYFTDQNLTAMRGADTFTLYYLDRLGYKVAKTVFNNVRYIKYNIRGTNYRDDEKLEAVVLFNYSSVENSLVADPEREHE